MVYISRWSCGLGGGHWEVSRHRCLTTVFTSHLLAAKCRDLRADSCSFNADVIQIEEKWADSADVGHPGLCLEQCQIRVVAGFGSSLAYCPFISQIEPLFLTRVWLSNLNTNLNQTEALSLSDSHKSWIKNSWKCCQNIWMKGWPPDFANEPSIWPKIRLIMKFLCWTAAQTETLIMQPFSKIHRLLSFFRDDLPLLECRRVLCRRDFMCSFISNFFIQLCFSSGSHNYGNRLKEKLGLL